MKIVADDKIPFLKGVFEPFGDINYLPGNEISNESLKDAEVLLTRSITVCNARLLKNTQVKLIATATIGDDHIDKQYCLENGIQWATAKGCNAGAVVQYVTSALLEKAAHQHSELSGKTIGIIGAGEIGSRVAKAAGLLGMNVLLNDPPRARTEGRAGFVSLQEIQQKAHYITLHVPLTFGGVDKTFYLLNDDFFEGLANPVVLINTARGAVLDTEVIKQAFQAGQIKKLVIDVWENEPDIDLELLQIAGISTPHIAGYSIEGKANATAMTVHAVSDFYGLGMEDWFPQIAADQRQMELDCKGLSNLEIFRMVFNAVYPVQTDSVNLKSAPEHFSQLRQNYIFRHENRGWKLILHHADEQVKKAMKSFGFHLITN